MLVFSQSNGSVTLDDAQIALGWAGNHDGKNNPEMQDAHGVGPLPRGFYTLDGWEEQHPHLGRMVCHLTPDPDNEMFGRDGFYIHGASSDPERHGQESMGCIVLEHVDREIVKNSGETRLQVTA